MEGRRNGSQPPPLSLVASPSPAKIKHKLKATEKPRLSQQLESKPVRLPAELFAIATSRNSQADLALSKAMGDIQTAATRLESERAKLVIQSQELQIWDMAREEELVLLRAENEQLEAQLLGLSEKISRGLGRDGVVDSLSYALRKMRAERDAEVREADTLFNQLQEAKAAGQELRELCEAFRTALAGLGDDWSAVSLLAEDARELRELADAGALDPTALRPTHMVTLLRGLTALATRSRHLTEEVQALRGEKAGLQDALDLAHQMLAEVQQEEQQRLQQAQQQAHTPSPNRRVAAASGASPSPPKQQPPSRTAAQEEEQERERGRLHKQVEALNGEASSLRSKLEEYRSYMTDNQEEIEALQNEVKRLKQASQAPPAYPPGAKPDAPSAAFCGVKAAGSASTTSSTADGAWRRHHHSAHAHGHHAHAHQQPLTHQGQVGLQASNQQRQQAAGGVTVAGTPTRHVPYSSSPISTVNYASPRGQAASPAHDSPRRGSPLLGSPQQEQMAADIAQKVSELQELAMRAQQQHQVDLEVLRAQHVAELQALRQNLATEHAAATEALRAQLATTHGSAVAHAKAQHAAALAAREAELQAQHAATTAELAAKHAAAVAAAAATARIEVMRTLEEEHRRSLGELSSQHAAVLADRESQLTVQLSELVVTSQQRELELRREHADALATQAVELRGEIAAAVREAEARAVERHAAEAGELERRLTQVAAQREAEARRRHADRLAEQAAQLAAMHAEQAAALSAQHAAALAGREAQLVRGFEEQLMEREAALMNAHAEQLAAAEARHAAAMAARESAMTSLLEQRLAEREAALVQAHAEQMAETEARRSVMMAAREGALVQGLEAQLAQRLAQQAAALAEAAEAELARQRAVAVSTSQTSYVQDIARLSAQHEAALAAARADLERQLQQQRQYVAELTRQLAEAMEARAVTEAAFRKQLADGHASAMEAREEQHAAELKRLRDKHASVMARREENHVAELQSILDAHAKEAMAREQERDAELEEREEKYGEELAARKEAHEAAVQQLREEHATQVAAREATHATALQQLKEQHAAELASRQEERNRASIRLRQEHADVMLRLEEQRREQEAELAAVVERDTLQRSEHRHNAAEQEHAAVLTRLEQQHEQVMAEARAAAERREANLRSALDRAAQDVEDARREAKAALRKAEEELQACKSDLDRVQVHMSELQVRFDEACQVHAAEAAELRARLEAAASELQEARAREMLLAVEVEVLREEVLMHEAAQPRSPTDESEPADDYDVQSKQTNYTDFGQDDAPRPLGLDCANLPSTASASYQQSQPQVHGAPISDQKDMSEGVSVDSLGPLEDSPEFYPGPEEPASPTSAGGAFDSSPAQAETTPRSAYNAAAACEGASDPVTGRRQHESTPSAWPDGEQLRWPQDALPITQRRPSSAQSSRASGATSPMPTSASTLPASGHGRFRLPPLLRRASSPLPHVSPASEGGAHMPSGEQCRGTFTPGVTPTPGSALAIPASDPAPDLALSLLQVLRTGPGFGSGSAQSSPPDDGDAGDYDMRPRRRSWGGRWNSAGSGNLKESRTGLLEEGPNTDVNCIEATPQSAAARDSTAAASAATQEQSMVEQELAVGVGNVLEGDKEEGPCAGEDAAVGPGDASHGGSAAAGMEAEVQALASGSDIPTAAHMQAELERSCAEEDPWGEMQSAGAVYASGGGHGARLPALAEGVRAGGDEGSLHDVDGPDHHELHLARTQLSGPSNAKSGSTESFDDVSVSLNLEAGATRLGLEDLSACSGDDGAGAPVSQAGATEEGNAGAAAGSHGASRRSSNTAASIGTSSNYDSGTELCGVEDEDVEEAEEERAARLATALAESPRGASAASSPIGTPRQQPGSSGSPPALLPPVTVPLLVLPPPLGLLPREQERQGSPQDSSSVGVASPHGVDVKQRASSPPMVLPEVERPEEDPLKLTLAEPSPALLPHLSYTQPDAASLEATFSGSFPALAQLRAQLQPHLLLVNDGDVAVPAACGTEAVTSAPLEERQLVNGSPAVATTEAEHLGAWAGARPRSLQAAMEEAGAPGACDDAFSFTATTGAGTAPSTGVARPPPVALSRSPVASSLHPSYDQRPSLKRSVHDSLQRLHQQQPQRGALSGSMSLSESDEEDERMPQDASRSSSGDGADRDVDARGEDCTDDMSCSEGAEGVQHADASRGDGQELYPPAATSMSPGSDASQHLVDNPLYDGSRPPNPLYDLDGLTSEGSPGWGDVGWVKGERSAKSSGLEESDDGEAGGAQNADPSPDTSSSSSSGSAGASVSASARHLMPGLGSFAAWGAPWRRQEQDDEPQLGQQTPTPACRGGARQAPDADDADTCSLLAAGATLGSSERRRRQRRRMGDAPPPAFPPLSDAPSTARGFGTPIDSLRLSWEFRCGLATPLSPPGSAPHRHGRAQGHPLGPASPAASAGSDDSPGVPDTMPQGSAGGVFSTRDPSKPPALPRMLRAHAIASHAAATPASAAPANQQAATAAAPASPGPVTAPPSARDVRQRGRAVLGRVAGRVAELEGLVQRLSAGSTPAQPGSPRMSSSQGGCGDDAGRDLAAPAAANGAMQPPEPHARHVSIAEAAAAALSSPALHSAGASSAAGPASSSLSQPPTPCEALGLLSALDELRGDLNELQKLHQLSQRSISLDLKGSGGGALGVSTPRARTAAAAGAAGNAGASAPATALVTGAPTLAPTAPAYGGTLYPAVLRVDVAAAGAAQPPSALFFGAATGAAFATAPSMQLSAPSAAYSAQTTSAPAPLLRMQTPVSNRSHIPSSGLFASPQYCGPSFSPLASTDTTAAVPNPNPQAFASAYDSSPPSLAATASPHPRLTDISPAPSATPSPLPVAAHGPAVASPEPPIPMVPGIDPALLNLVTRSIKEQLQGQLSALQAKVEELQSHSLHQALAAAAAANSAAPSAAATPEPAARPAAVLPGADTELQGWRERAGGPSGVASGGGAVAAALALLTTPPWGAELRPLGLGALADSTPALTPSRMAPPQRASWPHGGQQPLPAWAAEAVQAVTPPWSGGSWRGGSMSVHSVHSTVASPLGSEANYGAMPSLALRGGAGGAGSAARSEEASPSHGAWLGTCVSTPQAQPSGTVLGTPAMGLRASASEGGMPVYTLTSVYPSPRTGVDARGDAAPQAEVGMGPYSPEELSQLHPSVQLFAPPQLRAAAVAVAHAHLQAQGGRGD